MSLLLLLTLALFVETGLELDLAGDGGIPESMHGLIVVGWVWTHIGDHDCASPTQETVPEEACDLAVSERNHLREIEREGEARRGYDELLEDTW